MASKITTNTEPPVEMIAETTAETTNNGRYLTGWPLASLIMAFMMSAFLLALDSTVIATAIPRMTSDFNSLNDIGWYGAAYLVAQIALIPTCGRIYTFYNIKWTYCALLTIFGIGSIVCAAAPSSMAFIIGRAVAGLGGAGLLSGAAVIVSYCVELNKRAFMMAIIFATYSLGSVVGPLIGGVITDNKTLTWRFIFWLNLPVGAIAMAQIWFTLRKPPPPAKAGLSAVQKIRQMDIPGTVFLMGSIVCLLLALQWGGTTYSWSDSRVFGCLIGFGLLLAVFLFLQFRDQVNCTIPLYIFKCRSVGVSCVFMLFFQLSFVAQTYYWPIYFQSIRNTSARDSGIYLLPLVISNGITTLVVGWLVSKIGHYVPFMICGSALLAVGSGLYQLISAHSPASEWIGFQIVSGLGYGMSIQLPILAIQVVLDDVDVPTGCVMVIFFQCLGGALATSVGQNIFTDSLIGKLHKLHGVDASAIVDAGAKDFRAIVPQELLFEVIDAFQSALRRVFLLAMAVATIAFASSWLMEWRKVPQDPKRLSEAALTEGTKEQTGLDNTNEKQGEDSKNIA